MSIVSSFLSIDHSTFIIGYDNGTLSLGSSSDDKYNIQKIFQTNTKAITSLAKNSNGTKILVGSEDGVRRFFL